MTLLLQHVSIPSYFQSKNQPSQILIGHKCMSVCVAKHVIVQFQKAVSCYTVQQETFKRCKVFGLQKHVVYFFPVLQCLICPFIESKCTRPPLWGITYRLYTMQRKQNSRSLLCLILSKYSSMLLPLLHCLKNISSQRLKP